MAGPQGRRPGFSPPNPSNPRGPVGGGGDPTGGVGGVPRTLDVGGPELVVNGQFPTDIAGWTDSSSAGGVIAWVLGALRSTNTTGTARARQAVTVENGARYAFAAFNPAATVAGTVALGSTTPGSNDLLSTNTNPAIAARAGIEEVTAPTTTANIQLSTGTAGTDDWDNVTLRKLIPTIFTSGKVFTDDFTIKADGPLGVTLDGLIWRQMKPQNSAHVYPLISSGKLVAGASGVHCDIAWSATGGTVAMVSLTPSATLPTTSMITTNSLHVVFTDTKVDVQVYVAGVLTTVQTITYPVACATDGTVYQDVGWFLDGNTHAISPKLLKQLLFCPWGDLSFYVHITFAF